MGKVVLYMQMSLDGVVGDVDQWATISDEIMNQSTKRYDDIAISIYGGNTYPGMAEYWQDAEKNSADPLEKAFAKKINDKDKLVVSRTPKDLTWRNSGQLIFKDADSFRNEIDKLKKENSKDIVVESGAGMWQLFIKNNLYDQLQINIHPVIAGKGDKLFETGLDKANLKLDSSRMIGDGVLELWYSNTAKS